MPALTPRRIGVIGGGFIAQVAHLPQLIGRDDARIVALAEDREELRDAVADRFSIPRRHRQYADMLAAGGLDGVVVAMPRRAQSAIVRDVLDAGLPVLTEKPLAFRADVAADLVEAEDVVQRGLAIGLAHHFGFSVGRDQRREDGADDVDQDHRHPEDGAGRG